MSSVTDQVRDKLAEMEGTKVPTLTPEGRDYLLLYIERARSYIATPDQWVKGLYGMFPDGTGLFEGIHRSPSLFGQQRPKCCCLRGAFECATLENTRSPSPVRNASFLESCLIGHLHKRFGAGLEKWNDQVGRTHAQVLDFLLQAEEMVKSWPLKEPPCTP